MPLIPDHLCEKRCKCETINSKQNKIKLDAETSGKVAMTVAFTLVIAIFLLAMLGTVVQAAGLVDDTVNVANEYSRYPLENYQLDFYVDNSWAGFRGTGRTGLENRSCMDYMPLPILFGQSVCMFPMRQVT